MRSNNKLLLLTPLMLAACGGGYRDPPGLEPVPEQQQQQQAPRTYPAAPDYPTSVDPRYSGPGTSYSAPGEQRRDQGREHARQVTPRNLPARDLGPEDAYTGADTAPPPAAYPPQNGYPGANGYPPQTGYPAQDGYPPASYPPANYPAPPRTPSRAPSRAPDYPPAAAAPAPLAQLSAEQRYDNVGYAGWASQMGTIAGAHRVLPPGSFVEVTSLDTGKTIVVPITARAQSNREIELSGAAAQLLGFTSGTPAVRVRRIVPTPADQNRLRAGQPAEPRFDTPPVLLRALRSRLTQGGVAPPPPVDAPVARAPISRAPVSRAPAARAPAPQRQTSGYYVQLAALSTNARASALAREAGAAVRQQGALWLVRAGPFEDLRTAQAARDDLARRGYGDARIVKE